MNTAAFSEAVNRNMSTFATQRTSFAPPITLETMAEAISKIKPMPKQKIVMCKKHWEKLKKQLGETPIPEEARMFSNSFLGGLPVTIRPYLKKVRIYTENE